MVTETPREELDRLCPGALVIASVSGGKDSAALSLWLREQGIEHERVFADTGWEHADTYEYLRGPLTRVLGPIHEVRAERQMVDLVRHKGMFPSRLRRWCTDELKVNPLHGYMRQRAETTGREVVNAVGIRAEESAIRAKMLRWDGYRDARGFVSIWRPILTLSEQDVIDLHKRHGLPPNPLYLRGASRVGCWPCIFARKAEVRMLANVDPARIDEIEALEHEITAAADARAAAKGETNQNPRTWFQGRGGGDAGRSGAMPIREVVRWSRTSRGGTQFELFASDPGDDGCVRWGMCEQAPADE